MQALETKLETLKTVGTSDAIAQHINSFLRNQNAPKLTKMSPYRLADDWGVDRREVLEAFLHGTRSGLFDMEWALRCPSCTGPTMTADHISGLAHNGHCDYCTIDFDGALDATVEITFQVSPEIRDVSGVSQIDMMNARNELEPPKQMVVPAGETLEVVMTLDEGTWHLFDPSMVLASPLLVHGEPSSESQEVVYTISGSGEGRGMRRGNEPRRPGTFTLRIVNDSLEPATLLLARAVEVPWVSGASIACNQEFRDLFTNELLDPDDSLAVRNLTFLFTDIKGSTELYERLGDSQAYALVKSHFRILTRLVRQHRGAIVKTIGDAVMATFTTSADAVAAFVEINDAFADFNRENEGRDDVIIKVGMHRGPCIAVTSNDRLDYFGRTVNTAARIQGLSNGHDMVLSASCADDPICRGLIEGTGWREERFGAHLKGIAPDYPVVRLLPQ